MYINLHKLFWSPVQNFFFCDLLIDEAGSGDLLTGFMTALLSYNCDTFRAVCMAVWIHGYLADLAVQKHSIRGFDFSMIPSIMDELFNKHGF